MGLASGLALTRGTKAAPICPGSGFVLELSPPLLGHSGVGWDYQSRNSVIPFLFG